MCKTVLGLLILSLPHIDKVLKCVERRKAHKSDHGNFISLKQHGVLSREEVEETLYGGNDKDREIG